MLAVFLTHASPPSHIAADSEIINAALSDSHRNRRVRAGEGFNRRVSISVLYSNAHDLRSIGAPKLSARAAGIESVRYDFDKISLITIPEGIPLGLSRKESDIIGQDSTGLTARLCVPREVRHSTIPPSLTFGRFFDIISSQ
jgi:hypothetical protein